MIKVLSTQFQINCIGCQDVADHQQEVNSLISGGIVQEVGVGLMIVIVLVQY